MTSLVGSRRLVLPFLTVVCSIHSSHALAIRPPLLDQLTSHAVSYASAHGLQVASKQQQLTVQPDDDNDTDDNDDNDTDKPKTNPIQTYECAPISLLPNAYPRSAFVTAQILARPFNLLVERLSQDGDFLVSTLKDVGDPFTAKLLMLYQDIYMHDTHNNAASNGEVQKNHAQLADRLGIQRSDYMLNDMRQTTPWDPYRLQQVELNTIAASFAALAVQVAALHRHVVSRFGSSGVDDFLLANKKAILGDDGTVIVKGDGVPFNPALTCIPEAMDSAFQRYQERHCETSAGNDNKKDPNLVMLFIVQDGETNTVDQRMLEFRLWQNHRIPVMRLTLTAAHEQLALNEETGALTIAADDDKEVAVVYFRAGYAPTDYMDGDDGVEWQARELMERSRATKCPSLGYHLAGTKKIQQALARPGILERFISDKDDGKLMRSAFAGLYSLGDDAGPDDLEAVRQVVDEGQEGKFVLKPQREGGGYNFYGERLLEKLRQNIHRGGEGDDTKIELQQELSEFILMERLFPPQQDAILLRSGRVEGQGKSISELGCFGTILVAGDDQDVVSNKYAGFLLRTKFENVDEGGVASGFATLSSPYLCSSD
jgi:glutathione synthetase